MDRAYTEAVPHRAISVLIVDDNRVDRQRCRRMLEHHPEIEVCATEAATVDEAESMCRTTWFDCIIADYELPLRKGTDLARDHRDDTNPPVILLTGNGDEVVAMEALQAGVCDYIKKNVLNEKALQNGMAVLHFGCWNWSPEDPVDCAWPGITEQSAARAKQTRLIARHMTSIALLPVLSISESRASGTR